MVLLRGMGAAKQTVSSVATQKLLSSLQCAVHLNTGLAGPSYAEQAASLGAVQQCS
jgi:hypothetical protein